MAAINFPASPTLNQTYTENGITFTYDGSSWSYSSNTASGSVSISSAAYSITLGDGSNTSFNVTHNLIKSNVISVIRETSSGNIVYPSLKIVNSNTVNVGFASAPSSAFYTISILGF